MNLYHINSASLGKMNEFISNGFEELYQEMATDINDFGEATYTFDCSKLSKTVPLDVIFKMIKARLRIERGTTDEFSNYYKCSCHYINYRISVRGHMLTIDATLRHVDPRRND